MIVRLLRLPLVRVLLALGVVMMLFAAGGAVLVYRDRHRPPPPIPPSTNTVEPGSFRVDGPATFPSAACADTSRGLFVANTGSDSAPGTQAQPYRTIETGLKNLRARPDPVHPGRQVLQPRARRYDRLVARRDPAGDTGRR